MAYEEYVCVCGARSDLGDITDHVVSKLRDPDDSGEHRILGDLPEDERITAAREAEAKRESVREKIQTVLGISAEELADALRGLG